MNQENYHKIKQFVHDNYQQISAKDVLITRISEQQFQVGDWTVQDMGDKWQVSDAAGVCNATLLQPRLALLTAVLLNRGKRSDATHVNNMDVSYNIFNKDLSFYLQKTRADPDNPVYQDRLDNARRSLDLLRDQISEMEKTVKLQ
jgi:hypothetical protein